MQRKYFLYDPAGDGFQTFSAKEQRDAAAQKAIADCLQDGYWIDDVLAITVGEITGVASKANVIHRPDSLNENGEDEDGDYWDRDVEEKHDVEIQSVADTSAPQAELATLREKLKWRERLEELELEGIAAFLDGKPSDSHGLADAGEQAAWLAGYESQQELTALRAKLAAAEASLAERGRMLETTHRVQRSYRAAAAAALAELRAEWVRQIAYYETRQSESDYAERLAELEIRLRELDAVIAKLDLAEKEKSND